MIFLQQGVTTGFFSFKVISLSADEALQVNSILLHLFILLILTLMLLLLPRPIGPSTLALFIRNSVMRRGLKPLRLIRGSITCLLICHYHRSVSRPSHSYVTLLRLPLKMISELLISGSLVLPLVICHGVRDSILRCWSLTRLYKN
jgi:hypothetical protein